MEVDIKIDSMGTRFTTAQVDHREYLYRRLLQGRCQQCGWLTLPVESRAQMREHMRVHWQLNCSGA